MGGGNSKELVAKNETQKKTIDRLQADNQRLERRVSHALAFVSFLHSAICSPPCMVLTRSCKQECSLDARTTTLGLYEVFFSCATT